MPLFSSNSVLEIDGTIRTDVVLSGMPAAGGRTLHRALAADLDDVRVTSGPDVAHGAPVGLFLIDPVAIAGDDDVRLLSELRSHAAAVALVCTKIDAFWDWPDALYPSRELLDPDRRLPVFAVTAAGALAGARSHSGLPDLVEWIRQQWAVGAESLQSLESDSLAQNAIDEVRAEIRADDSAVIARRRESIVARRDRGRTDRLHAVRVASGQLRAQQLAEIHADSRSFTNIVGQEVDRIRGRGNGFEVWFRDELGRRYALARQRLAEELAAGEGVATAGLDEAPHQLDTSAPAPPLRSPRCRPVPPTAVRREDLMVVVLGASAGLGLGRLVVLPMAAVDTLKWVSMPLSLLLGFVVAAVVVRERRLGALRGRLRGWALDGVTELRMALEQEVVGAIGAAESTLAGRIGRHYERRSRSIAEQAADLDSSLAAAHRQRADAEERLAELLAARRVADSRRAGDSDSAEPMQRSPAS